MVIKFLLLGLFVWGSLNAATEQPQTPGQRTQTVTAIEPPKEEGNPDVLSVLSQVEREQIAKSAIPVLLLKNIREFEPRLVVQDLYYSAFFVDGKQSVSIQGSRVTTSYADLRIPSDSPKKSVRSTNGFITESEGIWTASWKEFGASYLLSVECKDAKDKRCESEEHVSNLANSLVYVGGGKVEPGTKSRMLADEPAIITTFAHNPPGQLLPGSGQGRPDDTVYAPGIRFPIENKPAYANSQSYNRGGKPGPPGSECHSTNYSYPWWDNFCETRRWNSPLCPSGHGHQGQDIRPSSCKKDKHFAVSATDGIVTHIGPYSVFITAPDGTQYRYLHMSNVLVKYKDAVTKAMRIGLVSNVYKVPTTIHLHFEIVQNIAGVGFVHVPPYMSLVTAYELLP
jgi:murein DD-endopeptidase MepM/ murein hydrolase activator NlpD